MDPPGDIAEEPRRRLVENELAFRRLNLKIEELDRAARLGEGEPAGAEPEVAFLCECSRPDCRQRLPIGVDAYAAAHSAPDCFTLAPGHEVARLERVVDRGSGYVVVEKPLPAAGA